MHVIKARNEQINVIIKLLKHHFHTLKKKILITCSLMGKLSISMREFYNVLAYSGKSNKSKYSKFK